MDVESVDSAWTAFFAADLDIHQSELSGCGCCRNVIIAASWPAAGGTVAVARKGEICMACYVDALRVQRCSKVIVYVGILCGRTQRAGQDALCLRSSGPSLNRADPVRRAQKSRSSKTDSSK